MIRQYPMNLQLFAEEKTEKATPKRRKDAREKGQVLKSMELNTTFILLSAFLGIKFTGPAAVKELERFLILFLDGTRIPHDVITISLTRELMIDAALSFGTVMVPFCLIVLLAGLAINYVQVGFLFSSKAMGFKFNRLNLLEGLKRMVSSKSFVQLLKAIIKTAIIGYTVYKEFMKSLASIPGLMGNDLLTGISYIIEGIFNIAFNACIAFAILSVLDYLYQWWEHEKELRMSKQEIKDEYKQMEGDPQLKGKIREKQRQIAMSRMMQQVPKADVVITNPTHFAVALLYEEADEKAPVVVAKGQDYMALRIRKIAREHNVHIVENRPLARSLYQSTEVGKEIPLEMYKAVAEILAYVYRMKKNL